MNEYFYVLTVTVSDDNMVTNLSQIGEGQWAPGTRRAQIFHEILTFTLRSAGLEVENTQYSVTHFTLEPAWV